jgi:hypothetical protein
MTPTYTATDAANAAAKAPAAVPTPVTHSRLDAVAIKSVDDRDRGGPTYASDDLNLYEDMTVAQSALGAALP